MSDTCPHCGNPIEARERWEILNAGLVKRINVEIAMARATEADRKQYPRLKWKQ